MKKNYCYLILFVVTLFWGNAFAQKDSITNKQNDSVTAATLAQYTTKLAEIEQQRISDSVKRAELEKSLKSLKTTDNLKKEELQKELEKLNSRDLLELLQKKHRLMPYVLKLKATR